MAFKRGDLSARLPEFWTGVPGKIADTFNTVIERNERMARELERIVRVVGKEGRITHRASLGEVSNSWADAIRCINTLIGDLVQPTHHAPNQRVTSPFAAKAVTTYAPRPPYPQEARSHRISGSGVCVVSVDPATGSVTKVSITRSTGSQLLDKSVLSTVRTWKFKPGTVSKVSIPVEFTNDGGNR